MVSDYAGQIEALKAKKIQMASLGSDAYAAAFDVTKGNVEPLVVAIDTMGSTGYNSIVIVQKDSPIKSIADLKGKSFAFADPNSTSGFLFPTFDSGRWASTPIATSASGVLAGATRTTSWRW